MGTPKSISFVETITKLSSPIVLVDLLTKNIIFLNEAAEKICGYSYNQLVGKNIVSFFKAKSVERVSAVFDICEATKTKELLIKENFLEFRRKSGRVAHVNVTFSLKNNFLIMNLEDLTDLIKLQKENEKIQDEVYRNAKLADIGRLTAGIAHELNNPLGIILGFIENIELELIDEPINKEAIKENLKPIHSSVLRMSRIVSKLMAMFRNEEVLQKPTDIQSIIDETLLLLEDSLISHGISLKLDIQNKWIKADTDQIVQVLLNILQNAINALEEKKENRTIQISSNTKDSKYFLEITNNGSAIPKNIQSKLFTPFVTTKEVGEGTGLGLFLSLNIIRSHGGNIFFESTNKKTKFILEFPILENTLVPIQEIKKSVIVVEDDTFFRLLITQKLNRLGISTIEYTNPIQALEYIEGNDLKNVIGVFSDLRMPKMSGAEFLINLRSKNSKIPFVFITGYPNDHEIIEATKRYPECRVLSKPIVNSELKLVIDALKFESELEFSTKKKTKNKMAS